ncbi:MAG TPA: radical SAM protein [Anaerolineales bacterium]|nr:radical SAM protein [Anaerolineales bacterium]
MSDILLGHSFFLRFEPKLWLARQPYPPLGTLYAAAYLRSRGYPVAVFDAMLAESEAEWLAALKYHQPRFAVLYEDNFNYLSKMCLLRVRQAAFEMIRLAKDAGCTVIVAGSDASDHAHLYLQQGCDYVLIGEGEFTLVDLLDRLHEKTDTPLQDIPGLAFQRDKLSATASAGLEILHTHRRPDIKDLDALPFPAWDLVEISRYQEIWRRHHGFFSINLVSTRGCPFHCNWCAKPIWGQRYNLRSPENVVAEMEYLRARFQPDHIWFADDIFGLKPGWLPRFAELVQERGVTIPYKCLNRADLLLRPGEIDSLSRSGAQIVWIGAESGSQKVLDAMEKGTRVEQIHAATYQLHQAGIQVGFFLQFGYPGETWRDIRKTIRMVRECQPDDIGISVSYPLPGTPFYERVRQGLSARRNWFTSDDLAMLYQGPYTTTFYRHLHTVLHKLHRARKIGNNLKPLVFRPAGWNRLHLRQAARLLAIVLSLPIDILRLRFLRQRKNRLHLPLISPALTQEQAGRPTPQLK